MMKDEDTNYNYKILMTADTTKGDIPRSVEYHFKNLDEYIKRINIG